MAYTNAQLCRMLVGDSGIYARDVSSGDGGTTEFWLSTPPVLGASALVYVGGTLKTETSDYTLDDASGRLVFVSAPPSVSGNVLVVYQAVQITDDDVTEALRQEGLTATATATPGDQAVTRAAIMLARAMAARLATIDTTASAAWAKIATELEASESSSVGLTSGSTKRVDGYSQDILATDVQTTATNPRRRYYGDPDRIP